tara:strand:- start:8219 stop:9928 length:1710 start_codon:yes stop_codon:yes gene_type:complete
LSSRKFYSLLSVLALLFITNSIFAQSEKKPTKIKLLNADQLLYDGDVLKARKLIGNVKFKHKGAIMTCDSAYLFTEENKVIAYSNVEINQGDTLFLYGDSLNYNGDSSLAELRGKIKLIDPDQELTTNYLDYNTDKKFAYYTGGGTIIKKQDSSILSSEVGYYYTQSKTFYFNKNVRIESPDYDIESDSLEYATEQNITYFHGPTTIISDSNTVYCEEGWFDQKQKLAKFKQNAKIISKEQTLSGDTIFYDQNTGVGEVFNSVSILDTINKFLISGDYALYNEKDSTSVITGNLEMIQFFEKDSLFLHADTLHSQYDSTRTQRQIFAYHKVRFYKSDLQGKCDSLSFNGADSTISMFRDPVIWSKANQMTGDTVIIRTYEGKIEHMRIFQDAMVVSNESEDSTKIYATLHPLPDSAFSDSSTFKIDSVNIKDSMYYRIDTIRFPARYNQIKGRLLIAYFDTANEVERIRVIGNGQTLYYGKEEDGTYIGLNRLDCSEMKLEMDSNEIQNITFYVQPKGTFYPMKDLTPELEFLRHFEWLKYLQPKKREDIFEWVYRKEESSVLSSDDNE